MKKPATVRTSIVLPVALIDALKDLAAKKGCGYQTLARMILHGHVNGESL